MSYSYSPSSNGKCPHCGHDVCFEKPITTVFGRNGVGQSYSDTLRAVGNSPTNDDDVFVYSSKCPNLNCQKPIVIARIKSNGKLRLKLVHPFNIVRLVPPEVPDTIRKDFTEAASVLPISEKASAALSRRCLQNMLNDKNFKGKDLSAQIDLVLKDLPHALGENLDAIRQIGNFAAHPMKFQTTGEIVDVEPHEASWNLDVLEQLFDYFYVQPKIAQARRNALNAKLQELGKPLLKQP